MVLTVILVDGASALLISVGPFVDIGRISYSTPEHPSVSLATITLLAISCMQSPPLHSDPLLFRNEPLIILCSSHPSIHTFAKCWCVLYGTIFLQANKSFGFLPPITSFHLYAGGGVAIPYLRNKSFPPTICLGSSTT